MSRKIRELTVSGFLLVLDMAIEMHRTREEPIPSFQESKLNELESCLCLPFQGFKGFVFYRGLVHKASILFYTIARNHILINGNKRMACLCTSFFCFLNDYNLYIPEEKFYNLAKEVVMAEEKDKDKTIKKIERVINQYKTKRR